MGAWGGSFALDWVAGLPWTEWQLSRGLGGRLQWNTQHRTLREFRRVHLSELTALFVQVVRLAREAGLAKLGRVGIDGTKVKANASKHKAMSYARMREREKALEAEIEALTRRAAAEDEAEDREYGTDHRGDELPRELPRRQDRLEVIRAAPAARPASVHSVRCPPRPRTTSPTPRRGS